MKKERNEKEKGREEKREEKNIWNRNRMKNNKNNNTYKIEDLGASMQAEGNDNTFKGFYKPGCFCLGCGRFVTHVCGHIRILTG